MTWLSPFPREVAAGALVAQGEGDIVTARIRPDIPGEVRFTAATRQRRRQGCTAFSAGRRRGSGDAPSVMHPIARARRAPVANGVRGVASEPNSSPNANVLFSAPAEIDQISLAYFDNTRWRATQVIGIHDLRWC